MKKKFGQFEWRCYADNKPSADKYIYVTFNEQGDIWHTMIGTYCDFSWNDEMYWHYVYMPPTPIIEKKEDKPCLLIRIEKLEDRIDSLTNLVEKMMNHYDRLEERIDKLNILMGNSIGSIETLLNRINKLEEKGK
jgi:hypothetical protein